MPNLEAVKKPVRPAGRPKAPSRRGPLKQPDPDSLSPRHHVIETPDQLYVIYRKADLAGVPDRVLLETYNTFSKRRMPKLPENKAGVRTKLFELIRNLHGNTGEPVTSTVLGVYDPEPAKFEPPKRGRRPTIRPEATTEPEIRTSRLSNEQKLFARKYLGEPLGFITAPEHGSRREKALNMLLRPEGATEKDMKRLWPANFARGLKLLREATGYGLRIDGKTGRIYAYQR